MKKLLFALAIAAMAASCGDSKTDAGPAEEEMKTAASRLLLVPEDKITFTKGKCRSRDKGYVCEFEMYIAFNETPTKQELNQGYFYKSDDDVWVMELVG